MSTTAPPIDRRRIARSLVLAFDVVALLAPPVYWMFAEGQASVWYFLIANALVTLSLFVLWAISDRAEGDVA